MTEPHTERNPNLARAHPVPSRPEAKDGAASQDHGDAREAAHGSLRTWRRGCRCDPCRAAKAKEVRDYRARRRAPRRQPEPMPPSAVELVATKSGYRTACTGCGELTIVAAPIARRIAEGVHSVVCLTCRELAKLIGSGGAEEWALRWALEEVGGLSPLEATAVLARRRPLPERLVRLLAEAGFLDRVEVAA